MSVLKLCEMPLLNVFFGQGAHELKTTHSWHVQVYYNQLVVCLMASAPAELTTTLCPAFDLRETLHSIERVVTLEVRISKGRYRALKLVQTHLKGQGIKRVVINH